MAKDALTVLREARKLISDPERWTQGHEARDEIGNACDAGDPEAKCWCALGAVAKTTGLIDLYGIWGQPATLTLDKASFSLFKAGPATVNDGHGHEAVLRMFDAAIASAEKEAGNAVQA